MNRETNPSADLVDTLRGGMKEAGELMSQAARHITYQRTLIKEMLPYVPLNHPHRPGMVEEAEKS